MARGKTGHGGFPLKNDKRGTVFGVSYRARAVFLRVGGPCWLESVL